jgi:RimJ/RimL family protein N-acetyltransferase
MARVSLPAPTLHTARLRLRPVTRADADALFALHSNAYVLRYWDAPPWTDPARAERFVAASRQMAEEGSGARLAIDRASDGAFIGWCALSRWNPDFRSASLGYCLSDAAWGHGYATEAARALLDWAFATLDLNRVQAETDTRNAASARVLEKLGFVREGTLREDCIVNGDVSDSWVYGLLRRQWRPSSERGPSRHLVPHDGWWEIAAPALAVTQCRVDYAVDFVLADADAAFLVRIEQPFVLTDADGRERLIDPERRPPETAPVLALLDRPVLRVAAFADGRLELGFAGAARVEVAAGTDHESWQLSGPDGLRLVSMPGGELAVWS